MCMQASAEAWILFLQRLSNEAGMILANAIDQFHEIKVCLVYINLMKTERSNPAQQISPGQKSQLDKSNFQERRCIDLIFM